MGRIEKTVFISYRRTNLPWALAIYQDLTHHGYDVFFDFESTNSGDFEQIILGNIRARAHFIVILTPSALERCENTDDWLRREIETALDCKRNIVPVMLEGFNFGSPSIAKYLTGKMALLKKYNGLNVPADYFEEAMGRLRNKYLNIPLDAVLHPLSNTMIEAVRGQQIAAGKATKVKQKELSVQEWFEQGYKYIEIKQYDDAIHCYDEVLRLEPEYTSAYLNRGFAHENKGLLQEAVLDYEEAIRIKPDYGLAIISVFIALHKLGKIVEAQKYEPLALRLIKDENEYNQACFEAIRGNTGQALKLLKSGLEKKQMTKKWARQDPDFDSIRNDPRFKELVGE